MNPSRPDWMLIDGSSLIFRAFYASRPTQGQRDRPQTNSIARFVDMLARLVSNRQPVRLAIASDEDWRPQHRVDLIPSYKAHRVAEPIPPQLIPQMSTIEAILAALGLDYVGRPTLEAEDVIASWVEQIQGRVEIVSGDRDLFTLIHDPAVKVLYPEKGGLAEVDEAEVTRRYGIPGCLYGDFAILRGDPSDGLPGLRGVGAEAAAGLIRKHGSIEALLASDTLSEADKEYVARAQKVVRPGSPEPVPLPEGTRVAWPVDPDGLSRLVSRSGIGDSIDRLLESLRVTQQRS